MSCSVNNRELSLQRLGEWNTKLIELHDKLALVYDPWKLTWPWTKSQHHLHTAKCQVQMLLSQIGMEPRFHEPMFDSVPKKEPHELLKYVIVHVTQMSFYEAFHDLQKYVRVPRSSSPETKALAASIKLDIIAFIERLDSMRLVSGTL